MKYLLDTHILLWSVLTPEKISAKVTTIFANTENELFISPITAWEIMLLAEKKRIVLTTTPDQWLQTILQKIPIKEAKLTHHIAIKSRLINLPHQDPADRFIAATAWEYNMTLITVDTHLLTVDQIETVN